MNKKILFPIVLLFILFACNDKNGQKQQKQESVPVKIIVATSKAYVPELVYPGTAYANKEANVGASLPGRVEKIHRREGDYVVKNALLAELSGEMFTQAKVEYETLKKDFERVSRLLEKESVSRQQYDHLKAKLDAAEAKMNMLKNNTEIKAPFSGIVVEYLLEEGENFFFNPGLELGFSHASGIVRLMQINPLKIEIEVNEKDIPKIQEGQKTEIRYEAFSDTIYTGTVENIRPMLSTTSRTATVIIKTKNNEKKIMPGMYCQVSIKLPEAKAVFVPVSCIYRQPGTGNDFIFINKENKASRVKVERGISRGDEVLVTGINPGDEVIVTGKSRLNNGTKIIVKNH